VSDIKLYRIAGGSVSELPGRSVELEKSLQELMEQNLEALLGVRLLASEYFTGKTHAGFIDTLGIDENGCPVIIEYKRAVNENVINQGLFYLDWLMDHQGEFRLLVHDKCSEDAATEIDWKTPRLLCIASGFTKYDEHAVQQINRSIELIRYARYGDDLLLLDLVNATQSTVSASASGQSNGLAGADSGEPTRLQRAHAQAGKQLSDLYESLKGFLLALGDDARVSEQKDYYAFKRLRNFACVRVLPQPNALVVYVRVDPTTVTLEEGFSQDVTNTGHLGTGDLELRLSTPEDLEKARPLLIRSYEAS